MIRNVLFTGSQRLPPEELERFSSYQEFAELDDESQRRVLMEWLRMKCQEFDEFVRSKPDDDPFCELARALYDRDEVIGYDGTRSFLCGAMFLATAVSTYGKLAEEYKPQTAMPRL